MPTRSLQLDGPDLQELLVRAMTEAGPKGRVASADRVRRGGIAGFFAREHFEVTVEVDEREEGGAPVTRTERARPRGWSDLAEGTEDVLELSDPVSSSTSSEGRTTPRHAPSPSGATDLPPVAPLGSEARAPSTEKASFAAMLSSIEHDTVSEDVVYEDTVASAITVPVPVTTISNADASTPAAPSQQPLGTNLAHSTKNALATWIGATTDALSQSSGPVVGADLVPQQETATCGGSSEVGSLGTGLAAVGLPERLLPERSVLECLETLSSSEYGRDYVQLALTSALCQLPEPPQLPERPGCVVAVVGELERALELAAQLAARAGVDRDSIVVASQARHRRGTAARRVICVPEDGQELIARSRRVRHPIFVAMHAPVSAKPDQWASRMLDVLSPDAVWGVAVATHKSEDIAAWDGGLGGLDALALEETAATTSPAQVLAAGIPVASLDGRRATPTLWAALIVSRLLLESSLAPASAKN